MADELIGRKLGPSEIVELIAADEFIEVFRGHHAEMDRPVLIKIVGRRLTDDPIFNARFRREARSIAGLRHPGIVRVYDFGQVEGGHYVVMDYVEAMPLAEVIAEAKAGRRVLEPDDITFIVRQVAVALDYAHSRGVVHRTVTPYTINITRSGAAILADFGMALLYARCAEATGRPELIGLPEYIAPEVLADLRAAAPASDVYSLGVVLYEMLTGQPPFEAGSDIDSALRDLTGAAPDPRLLNPDIPIPAAQVVLKALAQSPGERFRKATQLATALEHAYHPEIAPPSAPPPPVQIAEDGLPAARRPTAERVVVRRGPSRQEERREKRRLREEHQRIKRQEREERRRARQQERRAARQARRARRKERRRAFLARWGRSIVVVAVVLLLIVAAGIMLQRLGIVRIALVMPTAAPRPTSRAVAEVSSPVPSATRNPRSTPTATPTAMPTLTPLPTATLLQAASATPVPPLEFAPLSVGSSAFRLVDGAVMQFVPEGTFLMGTNDRRRKEDSRPRHPVMLSSYWIDRTEVTHAQYAMCMADGLCPPPAQTRLIEDPDFADYPVIYVPHPSAVAYCLWLAQETGLPIGLPTEAQWEKAAAWDPFAQEARLYPWGNNPPTADLAQYRGSHYVGSASAGSHPAGASAYGVLDMAGSVWEWVADWYDPTYYQRSGIPVDPTGPLTGEQRVTRGGGWYNDALLLLSSVRNPNQPTVTGADIGFRCAMNVERPLAGSGILMTPLDLIQALITLLEEAQQDPANDSTTLDEWMAALAALQSAYQSSDREAARTLISVRLGRLEEQSGDNLLAPRLVWQLERALLWMQEELSPVG